MSDAAPNGFRRLAQFDGARDHAVPQDRLAAIRKGAHALHEELHDADPVVYYRSFDLVRVPYPTKYGFLNACGRPTPYIHIMNRVFVVQFRGFDGRIKTLLMSPTDVEGSKATPFFRDLTDSMGAFKGVGARMIAPQYATVEEALARTGIPPEQVDYLSYDHLHTQDVRRWLGTGGRRGYFPNAKLLVMQREWEITGGHLPWFSYWYCPGGIEGVDPSRVELIDDDVLLGPGVALVRTPGHTEGNHSFCVRTPEGVMVTSENGVGPDAYAPEKSRVPGLRGFAKRTGAEVILNGNSIEGGIDQYLSMVAEKEIAGPSSRNPEFPNVVTSSEFTSYWMFAGLRPTFRFGALSFGEPRIGRAATEPPAAETTETPDRPATVASADR